MGAIAELAGRITLGEEQSFENMSLFPLLFTQEKEVPYLTLSQGLEQQFLTITEVSESGSVPELFVVNQGDAYVLLLDGEEVRGAKQNRVLNTTILIAPQSKVRIPVSCSEQGRWQYASRHFTDSDVVMARKARSRKMSSVTESLRANATYRSNQGQVWHDIELMQADVAAETPEFRRSATSAMRDVYEAMEERFKGAQESFRTVEGQKGMLVVVDDAAQGLDLLSSPAAFSRVFPKLIKSYAMDLVGRGGQREPNRNARSAAETFLKALAGCSEQGFPSIGHGEDIRLDSPSTVGSALVAEGCVVHLAMFRKDQEQRRTPDDLIMSGFRSRRGFRI